MLLTVGGAWAQADSGAKLVAALSKECAQVNDEKIVDCMTTMLLAAIVRVPRWAKDASEVESVMERLPKACVMLDRQGTARCLISGLSKKIKDFNDKRPQELFEALQTDETVRIAVADLSQQCLYVDGEKIAGCMARYVLSAILPMPRWAKDASEVDTFIGTISKSCAQLDHDGTARCLVAGLIKKLKDFEDKEVQDRKDSVRETDELVQRLKKLQKDLDIPDAPAPGWKLFQSKSPIDDSPTVVLVRPSDTKFQGWLKSSHPSLLIRCKEGKTSIFVNAGLSPHVGSGTCEAAATTRLDDAKAEVTCMSLSTNGEGLFFPNPVASIKKLLGHKRLLFQFTPFNASPAITTFQLDGLDEALKPLRAACKW